MPTVQDVTDFLGQDADAGQITAHLGVVTALASAYTRGNGFDPMAGDLAAVVVAATARSLANPDQVDHTVGSVTVRGGFTGWTIAEHVVLRRYRRRAA